MIKFPFQNAQELNLDWLMQMIRKLLDFLPVDQGAVGDVLQRGTDRAVWLPPVAVSLDVHDLTPASEVDTADELPIYDVSAQGNYKTTVQDILDLASAAPVNSVNGQTGAVVLDASDVGALPDSYSAPVDSVNGQTGVVVLDASDVGALPDTYSAPVSSVSGKTGAVTLDASDVGLGNVDNVQQYSATNPPPYPVTGQTGAVTVAGSSMTFGAKASVTVTVYAGLGTITAQSMFYRLSDDGKFLFISGYVDLNFVSTGDYTILLLSNVTLTGFSDNLTYPKTPLCFNSSGNLDITMYENSGFSRVGNALRISVADPASAGARKVVIQPTIIPLE